jgi:hypothetical protein
MRSSLGPQDPGQQDWDERGGGGDHREAHRQRQRNEEIMRRTLHEESGDEDCEDAKHREKTGDSCLGRAVIRSNREGRAASKMRNGRSRW